MPGTQAAQAAAQGQATPGLPTDADLGDAIGIPPHIQAYIDLRVSRMAEEIQSVRQTFGGIVQDTGNKLQWLAQSTENLQAAEARAKKSIDELIIKQEEVKTRVSEYHENFAVLRDLIHAHKVSHDAELQNVSDKQLAHGTSLDELREHARNVTLDLEARVADLETHVDDNHDVGQSQANKGRNRSPTFSRQGSTTRKSPKKEEQKKVKKEALSDTSSNDSSDAESADSTESDRLDDLAKPKRSPTRGRAKPRQKGPSWPGLKEIQPTNTKYANVVSYRWYRLASVTQSRSSRATAKVKDFIKRLEIVLKEHHFDGSDPIRILDFLARFVKEADIQDMTEAQAYLALPKFLGGLAQSQFEMTTNLGEAEGGGVTCWPEAVQYLLRNYATASAITKALSDLRGIRQNKMEMEQEFAERVNSGASRCGHVHNQEELISFFLDGLRPEIAPIVVQYRQEHPRATYLDLVQQARSTGDSWRARLKPDEEATAPKTRKQPVLLAEAREQSAATSYSSGSAQLHEQESNAAFLLQEEHGFSPDGSARSSSVASYSTAPDAALALDQRANMVQPQHLPYSDRVSAMNRPGWQTPGQNRTEPSRQQPMQRQGFNRMGGPPPRQQGYPRPPWRQTTATGLRIICHDCYEPDHTSPQCMAKLKDRHRVIENYEKLTPEEKLRVPAASYHRVRRMFAGPDPDAPPERQSQGEALVAEAVVDDTQEANEGKVPGESAGTHTQQSPGH